MSAPLALDRAPFGVTVTLAAVDGPLPLRRRMAEMGLRVGAEVTVIQRTAGGGRLLGVSGSRVAVDRGTARAISVLTAARGDSTRSAAGAAEGVAAVGT